jgi:cytoskeletal protein CcmA (bactofilin family)
MAESDNQAKRDLVLSGTGNASGGRYRFVKINGHGKVAEDIECDDFRINGTGVVQGSLNANTAEVHGFSRFSGDLHSNKLKIEGRADIDGSVSGKDIKVHGNIKVKGSLSGETVDIHGGAKIAGDCEAESFKVRGHFVIGGLLNAGEIDIMLLDFGSQAKEVGGEWIKVKKPDRGFQLKKLIYSYILQKDMGLKADTIEGDEIVLEYTKAKVVRGNRVKIGPGCEIELVEYKDHFSQDNGAVVNEHRKLGGDGK